ncbi:MAG: putative minor capsid protein [Bacteroides sp.]|nr:putative minor capsid protein [Eubacterium sp.]MCM1419630.1 putative minor capsid protein [Roseburia sp.]MCM1462968.1 putative minor capsid protein [Bacteroides sp.]
MFIKKIPRSFLIHTVTLEKASAGGGAFGKTAFSETETVKNVRIVRPTQRITVTRDNEDLGVSAILLHQPGISSPCTFEVGGYLTWQGRRYQIVSVEEQYEAERLHHTEVGLCL